MTSILIHHNEEIFPESYKFKPERWLEKRPEGAPPLDRYLVSFSKGSRQCAGMKYGAPYRYYLARSNSSTVSQKQSYTSQSRRFSADLTIRSCLKQPGWMLM